jgi:hypothetical protein
MSKAPYAGIATGLLLVCLFVAACSPLATQGSQPETEAPVSTASPAETATLVLLPTASLTETATLELLPTASLAPATPMSPFAPICELSVASTLAAPLCQRPIAEQSSAFCMNKVPFNLILVDAGATYELLSEGFECSDAGMKDDRRALMCSGPMGISFELRACGQQACALPTLPAEISQCPQGFWYDEPQGCCAFVPQPVEQSCVVLTLETKRCVINCAEFTKEDACNHHYHACLWNEEDKVCQVRR